MIDTTEDQGEREVNVIMPRSGKIVRVPESVARRNIVYGSALEADPDEAVMRDRILAEYRRAYGHRPDHVMETMNVFSDFEGWCCENACRALPASVETVVRYLLSRVADGKLENHQALVRADRISALHDRTHYPPRNLGKMVRDSYTRSRAFAEARLRAERVSVQELAHRVPAKALAMFPDGEVPRHYHDVAA